MTLDLRLLPLAAACWLGCAIGLHTGVGWGWLLMLALTVAIAVFHPHSLTVCVIVLVASTVAGLRVAAADPDEVADAVRSAGVVEFSAVINTEPRTLDQRGYGGLTTEEVQQSAATLVTVVAGDRRIATSIPVTLRWRDADAAPAVGAAVGGVALLHPDRPERRSAYIVSVRGSLAIERQTTRGSHWTTLIRGSLASTVRAAEPNARTGATLLPGLVLGDTRAQSEQLVEDLRISGLSHLTAVSGANVAIVLGAVLWMLQRTTLRRRYRYAVLSAVLLVFVAVVQPQPSVMRAAVMGAIAVYALATGSVKHSASALWLSVVLLLLLDPFMAWQYGFGLSVAATAGLIVLQPLMAERLPRNRVLGALLVTVAAQIATLPLLLLMGQPPTWLSIPANLLAEPLMAPATVSGFIATALASVALLGIPVLSPVLDLLARIVAVPGVLLSEVIVGIARVGAGSALAVSPFASLGSSLLFAAIIACAWHWRRHRRFIAALAGVYFVASTCGPQLLHPWPAPGWWFAMCDVGQGDATVLRTGPAEAIVIDAGPDSAAARSCLRRLGIRKVPLLVLTHFHADHVEGVAGVAAQAEIGRVVSTSLHDPLIEFQRATALLRRPIVDVQRGDHLRVGAVRLEVLWPDPSRLSGDPNNGSLVLLVRTQQGTVLLTGDVDADAQRQLTPVAVDILKVPHHGSKYQADEYLDAVRSRLALTSVGRGNEYGHPAAATVRRLEATGTRVLRTDVVGAIAVSGSGAAMAFATSRQ